MRNLKKILALVLALVMSLSLMATASAAETTSTDSADPYATAKAVLEGLGVVKGDAGTGDKRYDSNVLRSEAAAYIYRAATGDAKDEQTAIYTNHDFKDVVAGHWGAGYIAYCYNAEIIKGMGDGTFVPDGNVTGYQLLAMALRTLGYGRNGEFEGANYEIQTAATAKKEGLLAGVTAADETRLGQPAPRGLVTQIIFNTLLQYTALYNPYNPQVADGYSREAKTLGGRSFGLEEVKGVVTANEYADLDKSTPLAAGKTKLGSKTLDVTSYLSDIGESKIAYVVPSTQSYYKVLHMVDDPKLNTKDNEFNKNTAAALAKAMKVSLTDATEYYKNFEPSKVYKANIRLSYFIDIKNTVADEDDVDDWVEFLESLASPAQTTAAKVRVTRHPATATTAAAATGYTRIILEGETVTATDRAIMKHIFDYANLSGTFTGNKDEVVRGEVYVGTQSQTDVSDTTSYEAFVAARMTEEDSRDGSAGNGEYIKVIDHDNNGVADYVLKTEYILDEVAYVTSAGVPYFRFIEDDDIKYEANGGEVYGDTVELKVGDVVLSTAEIDGCYYAEVATPVNVTVQTVVYDTPKITTTSGADYLESAIGNKTTMAEKIAYMDEKVAYDVYLDKGEHVRAYKTGEASKYALLTEMYPTNNYNGYYVTNSNWIVELMGANDVKPVEYTVLNSYSNNSLGQTIENPFIDDVRTAWRTGVLTHTDYLQEAIAHLNWNWTTTDADASLTPHGDGKEFVWAGDQSWTNVGRCVQGDNGVYLYSASERSYSKDTHELMYYGSYEDKTDRTVKTYETDWKADYRKANLGAKTDEVDAAWIKWRDTAEIVYAVDYVQLEIKDIEAGNAARLYTRTGVTAANERTLYAVNTTQYYLVSRDGAIRTFTGYNKVPNIAAKDIHAIYAVAQNTEHNNVTKDYWVADVIVIELNNDSNYDSVSLIYNNPSQTTGHVRSLQALDSQTEGVKLNIRPESYVWGNQFGDADYEGAYWFYGLTGITDAGEANTVNARISPITKDNYYANGIMAGTVTEINGTANGGYYISVDTHNVDSKDAVTNRTLTVYTDARGNVPVYAIGKTSASAKGYTATEIPIDPSGKVVNRLKEGHKIVWVYSNIKNEDVAFIVDTEYKPTPAGTYTAASWLYSKTLTNVWTDIMDEQDPTGAPPTGSDTEVNVTYTVTNAEVTVNGTQTIGTGTSVKPYTKDAPLAIKATPADGYDTVNMTVDGTKVTLTDGTYTTTAAKDMTIVITGVKDTVGDTDTDAPKTVTVYTYTSNDNGTAQWLATNTYTAGEDYTFADRKLTLLDTSMIEARLPGKPQGFNYEWRVSVYGTLNLFEKGTDDLYAYTFGADETIPEDLKILVTIGEKGGNHPAVVLPTSRIGRTLDPWVEGVPLAVWYPKDLMPGKPLANHVEITAGPKPEAVSDDGEEIRWGIVVKFDSGVVSAAELVVAFTSVKNTYGDSETDGYSVTVQAADDAKIVGALPTGLTAKDGKVSFTVKTEANYEPTVSAVKKDGLYPFDEMLDITKTYNSTAGTWTINIAGINADAVVTVGTIRSLIVEVIISDATDGSGTKIIDSVIDVQSSAADGTATIKVKMTKDAEGWYPAVDEDKLFAVCPDATVKYTNDADNQWIVWTIEISDIEASSRSLKIFLDAAQLVSVTFSVDEQNTDAQIDAILQLPGNVSTVTVYADPEGNFELPGILVFNSYYPDFESVSTNIDEDSLTVVKDPKKENTYTITGKVDLENAVPGTPETIKLKSVVATFIWMNFRTNEKAAGAKFAADSKKEQQILNNKVTYKVVTNEAYRIHIDAVDTDNANRFGGTASFKVTRGAADASGMVTWTIVISDSSGDLVAGNMYMDFVELLTMDAVSAGVYEDDVIAEGKLAKEVYIVPEYAGAAANTNPSGYTVTFTVTSAEESILTAYDKATADGGSAEWDLDTDSLTYADGKWTFTMDAASGTVTAINAGTHNGTRTIYVAKTGAYPVVKLVVGDNLAIVGDTYKVFKGTALTFSVRVDPSFVIDEANIKWKPSVNASIPRPSVTVAPTREQNVYTVTVDGVTADGTITLNARAASGSAVELVFNRDEFDAKPINVPVEGGIAKATIYMPKDTKLHATVGAAASADASVTVIEIKENTLDNSHIVGDGRTSMNAYDVKFQVTGEGLIPVDLTAETEVIKKTGAYNTDGTAYTASAVTITDTKITLKKEAGVATDTTAGKVTYKLAFEVLNGYTLKVTGVDKTTDAAVTVKSLSYAPGAFTDSSNTVDEGYSVWVITVVVSDDSVDGDNKLVKDLVLDVSITPVT